MQVFVGAAIGFQTRDGFDTPNPCARSRFTNDSEETKLAGSARVSAAAEFLRVSVESRGFPADLHDSNPLAVFLTEELHHIFAVFDVVVFHLDPGDWRILENALVHQPLNV